MRVLLVVGFVLMALQAGAAEKRMTLHPDGARVETVVAANNGRAEIPLPLSMIANSLRVKPVKGALAGVDVVPVPPEKKYEAELASLVEKRAQLVDRLQALDVREEVFRAAAKSQSAKAPRKTKTTREPLEEIRKGTDFALSQLEEVYSARRLTKNRLQAVEGRLSTLRQSERQTGSIARIRFTGKEGKAVVSWLQAMPKWTPAYDFRLSDGPHGELTLYALLPKLNPAIPIAVAPSRFGEAAADKAVVAAASDGRVLISSHHLPVEIRSFVTIPQPAVSFSFRNVAGKPLPAGEISCYRQGEFIGKSGFAGSLQDEVREISFGTIAPGTGL